MITLHFYTREACSLCDSALAVVKRVQRRVPFHLECVDIDRDPALREHYGTVIPVLAHEKGELARSFFDEKTLLEALQKIASPPPRIFFRRSLDTHKG
jgi:hypothetical protein